MTCSIPRTVPARGFGVDGIYFDTFLSGMPIAEDTSGILPQVQAKFDEVGGEYDEEFLEELECSMGGITLYRMDGGWEVRKELMPSHEKIIGIVKCNVPKELMCWRGV